MKITNIHLRELLSGSLIAFVAKISGIVINYALLFLISNYITKDSVGYYSMTLVILLFLTTVLSFGLNFSITRLVNESINSNKSLKKLYKKNVKIILFLSVIGGFLLFIGSDFIANQIFKNENYSQIIKKISFFGFFYILTIFNIEFLRALKKIKASETIRNIVIPLSTLLFILLFFHNSSISDLSPVIALLFAVILGFFLSVFFVLKNLSSIKRVNQNEEMTTKKILNVSKPLLIMGICAFMLSESGLFFLEYYYNVETVGVYSIIYKIGIAATLVFTIVVSIAGPKVAELFWKEEKEELEKLMKRITRLIFFLSLPIMIVLLLFSDYLLAFFNVSTNHKLALIIILVSQFFYAVSAMAGIFLMVTDKQKIYRNIYIISCSLNIILCILLIPGYDILGASIAMSVSYLTLNILCNIYILKHKVRVI